MNTEQTSCEDVTGLPCEEGSDLIFPEGEAIILGVLEPGSILLYSDPDGDPYEHEIENPHQLIAIQDDQGHTALVIISNQLSIDEQGIRG
jgi:hypothetical protein